jgi:hypothetical protein
LLLFNQAGESVCLVYQQAVAYIWCCRNLLLVPYVLIRLCCCHVQFVDEEEEHLLHRCSGLGTAPAGHSPASQQHEHTTHSSAAAVAAAAAAGATSTPRLTRAEVFSLSSRPGALKKIVLDFDGHVTTNSKWNTAGQPVITSPPWDTDGDPTSFSEGELGQLKTIWSIVAEGAAQQ